MYLWKRNSSWQVEPGVWNSADSRSKVVESRQHCRSDKKGFLCFPGEIQRANSIDGLEVLRRTWSRVRGGGQADGALQHPGVHEGLR
jgi:hypothetical protein